MSATGTYVRAGLPEVATALAVLTGESHPLAAEGAHVGAIGPTRFPNGTDHLCKLLDLEGSAEDRRRTMDQIKVIGSISPTPMACPGYSPRAGGPSNS